MSVEKKAARPKERTAFAQLRFSNFLAYYTRPCANAFAAQLLGDSLKTLLKRFAPAKAGSLPTSHLLLSASAFSCLLYKPLCHHCAGYFQEAVDVCA